MFLKCFDDCGAKNDCLLCLQYFFLWLTVSGYLQIFALHIQKDYLNGTCDKSNTMYVCQTKLLWKALCIVAC